MTQRVNQVRTTLELLSSMIRGKNWRYVEG
jgi:hypothetical protein